MNLRTAGFLASIRRQEVRLLAEHVFWALDLLAFLPVFEAYMRSLAKKNGLKPEE